MNSLGILLEEEDDSPTQLRLSPIISLLPPLPHDADSDSLDDTASAYSADISSHVRLSSLTPLAATSIANANAYSVPNSVTNSTQSSPAIRQPPHFQFPMTGAIQHRNSSISSQNSQPDDDRVFDRPEIPRHRSGFSLASFSSASSSMLNPQTSSAATNDGSPVITVTERFKDHVTLGDFWVSESSADFGESADMALTREQRSELADSFRTKRDDEQRGFDVALNRLTASGWCSDQDILELQRKKTLNAELWDERLARLETVSHRTNGAP
ncbi:unnamed protein product [Kuraishia capsulata CBS 1993]|uniref:Uncharacterized protein n=1 Tax=Kuraishia capsulata CBS 1993 TaxID=1382522 RepID=W6MIX0_9ASCO|nr:uncharacterized protein KUCA_T00001864001 [Kuraishia capsulata CBS 1993]CDK25893.1 unnamed protein product [Kuraishia capsulata CBS 1993]